ncbi:MAG: UDP-2,3-diacylglucosamine diphosphatase [Phycisphaerales bacterium]
MSFRYRTIFVSDIHLGMRGVRSNELSAFLKHVECERLYLVGDILDLWVLKQRWHWPIAHNQVVRRILKLARKGTGVTYIPGNHDDALRQYAGIDLGGVRVAMQAVHRTADGRSLLITHGDEFDLVVKHSRLLSIIGALAYDQLLVLNRSVNGLRAMFGLRAWSFATAVKLKVKGACKFISSFEEAVIDEVKRRGLDGVVCGHVHQPALREQNGVTYANCGDFIERTSALVEHEDGRLELVCIEELLASAGIQPKVYEDEEVPLEFAI